jgi:hypothetical protein
MESMQLMTAEQVAQDFGLPSPRTVRTMRDQGLPSVKLGKGYLYDRADVIAFIQGAKETKCQDRIAGPISNGSRRGAASISSGMSRDAHESARLALQMCGRQSKPSPSSSRTDNVSAFPGHQNRDAS